MDYIKKYISKLKRFIKVKFFPYQPLKVKREKWNEQFKKGHWDYLWNSDQQTRYNFICNSMSKTLDSNSKVLDLGCGEGNLFKYIQDYNLTNYVGVDISSEAITKARELFNKKISFICEDLTTYVPKINFDFIVFNESLYYLDKPIKVLENYKRFLTDKGKIIISMWYNEIRNNKLWKYIDSNFEIEDQKVIKNTKGDSWIIKILR